MVLAYLLLALVGSATAGRTLGLALSVLSFLCFNFFLLPPYHTLALADPLNWVVLGAFLFTSMVASHLVDRARHATVRLAAEAGHAEALREAGRLKDALLASVSHDLRTPLTTIKALAQELRHEGDSRAVIIEEEADRLNRFVSDLLDLSRLEGGALPLTPELVAADDLLGAALQRLTGMAGDRRVQATIAPGEPLLVGRFDFTHSLRALVNLLENSLKYSPEGSVVEVEIAAEGDRLAFAVSDRGPGVSRSDHELIFEPFYRARGTSDGGGGTGLGLAIARRLARAQGGDVTYAARGGGGSVFTLFLPAVDAAEMEASL